MTAPSAPRVCVFGPQPLLTVTVELAEGGADDIHLHAGGQGVWVARMSGELGAHPILCGFVGGEVGAVLAPLLERLPGELRSVTTAAPSGSYVVDRRTGERRVVAHAAARRPSRHEVDELVSATVAAALASRVLVVCNPYPASALPDEIYGSLVADVQANGTPAIVDLSTPRLEHALEGRPKLVKLNDWELAEHVRGPVGEPDELRTAAADLRARGAETVLVTRGERSAVQFGADGEREIVAPRFDRGAREGCGDSMAGALAAAWAHGLDADEALRLGAGAGAANFLRHGLGTGSRPVVEELAREVDVRPWRP